MPGTPGHSPISSSLQSSDVSNKDVESHPSNDSAYESSDSPKSSLQSPDVSNKDVESHPSNDSAYESLDSPKSPDTASELWSQQKPAQYEEIFGRDIVVRQEGEVFDFPKIGVKLVVPEGAVDDAVKLRISVCDSFNTPPDIKGKCAGWVPVSPMVKIEPLEESVPHVTFKQPVELTVDHNLDMAEGTQEHIMAFHRDDENAEWLVIPTSDSSIGEKETFGFRLCGNKKVRYEEKTIVFEMYSTCHLHTFRNSFGVDVRCYRMSVMVYADYQPAAKKLNVRVHLPVDTHDRKQVVRRVEKHDYRGQFLDCEPVRLFPGAENVPLKINLEVFSNLNSVARQAGVFTDEQVSGELLSRAGQVPRRSFRVKIDPDCDSVDVNVTVTNDTATLSASRDLNQLIQAPPQ